MVDVVVSSSYGYRLGAVTKWAMDVEDPLSTAINDFPKRGILVMPFVGRPVMPLNHIQRSIVPSWAWKLVCRLPNARWQQMCDSDKIMAEVCNRSDHRASLTLMLRSLSVRECMR
jgi:hypothetical protein